MNCPSVCVVTSEEKDRKTEDTTKTSTNTG